MSETYHCQRCSNPIPVPVDGPIAPKFCLYCGADLDWPLPEKPLADDTAHAQADPTAESDPPPKPATDGSAPSASDSSAMVMPVKDSLPPMLPPPVKLPPVPPPPSELPENATVADGHLTAFHTPPPQDSSSIAEVGSKLSSVEDVSDRLTHSTFSGGLDRPPGTQEFRKGGIQQLGQYRIERSLGRGGFSEVYLARDAVLQRLVAIKVCDVASQGRDDHFQRFLREARLGASLDHPALCHIIDVQREDGVFYIVMEYIEGQNLDQLVRQKGAPLSITEASRYGLQLVDVLKYLGGKGIVHRDIKPHNVIVKPDQSLKLLDLGLGKHLDAPEDVQITQEGAIMGTPAFMAPEQCMGEAVTPAVDIYSAGVTLYFLLTMEFPFQGTMVEIFRKVLQDLPDDPRAHRPDLPDDVAQLILQMLAKRPRDRPSHDQVLNVLRHYAGGDSVMESSIPVAMPIPMAQASQRESLFDFLDHAAVLTGDSQQVEDELMRLLPRRDGNVYLGEYLLKRPVGRAGQFATYEGEMPFGGVACFIRTLPPSISTLDPERLTRLLNEHGQLMQISARSAHLSGITFLGRAELKRWLYPTVFYTVEPWIKGTSLQTIIDRSEDLSHKDASRYLAQAMSGLAALHEQQYLHGNLHPAKLLLDDMARDLLITDLTQIRRMSRSQNPLDDDPMFVAAQNMETAAFIPERRQYQAPELFVSNERPSPNTEQYALGVIFIEALTSHMGYVKSARENLDHFTKAREDLEDRLDEISGESPALTQVLWKMVKLNPRSRFANLREARNTILRSGHLAKSKPREVHRPASGKGKPKDVPAPAQKNRGVYDVFISYRREGGAAIARALVERLERRGQRVFLDVQTLPSGRFDTRLLRYIKNSRNFLLVLTPGSLDRCRDSIDDWLRIEISHAIKCRRNIVPVMLPDFEMPSEDLLPHALKSLRTLNGIMYDHLQFDGMIEKLQTFLK